MTTLREKRIGIGATVVDHARYAAIGLAEGAGFEPAIRFPAYTLSRRAPSATRPPLRHACLGHTQGLVRFAG